MPFAVNRDPEGFFILRSRLKKERTVRATKYFVRASNLAAPSYPSGSCSSPGAEQKVGRFAILVQWMDCFRKSLPPPRPRHSAGAFALTHCDYTVRTECTSATEVCWPLALLPSRHHWQQKLPQPFPSGSCWPVGPRLLLLPLLPGAHAAPGI